LTSENWASSYGKVAVFDAIPCDRSGSCRLQELGHQTNILFALWCMATRDDTSMRGHPEDVGRKSLMANLDAESLDLDSTMSSTNSDFNTDNSYEPDQDEWEMPGDTSIVCITSSFVLILK
jgi:hypothetical protein